MQVGVFELCFTVSSTRKSPALWVYGNVNVTAAEDEWTPLRLELVAVSRTRIPDFSFTSSKVAKKAPLL